MSAIAADVDVFACSDGRFYTRSEIRRRCRRGAWRFCLREHESGRILLEGEDRSLLALVPTNPAGLPPWIELRREGRVLRAVDTRRGSRSWWRSIRPVSGVAD